MSNLQSKSMLNSASSGISRVLRSKGKQDSVPMTMDIVDCQESAVADDEIRKSSEPTPTTSNGVCSGGGSRKRQKSHSADGSVHGTTAPTAAHVGNSNRHDSQSTSEDNEEAKITTASHYITRVGVKRKDTTITVHNTPKKRRLVNGAASESGGAGELQDVYCWECHKECVVDALDCRRCPRTFHPRCLPAGFSDAPPATQADGHQAEQTERAAGEETVDGEVQAKAAAPAIDDGWKCPVCAHIERLRDAQNKTPSMRNVTTDDLNDLLLHAFKRMRHSDSEPFQTPVPASLVPDYYDVVFRPMDLKTLENKVKRRTYECTYAFVEDTKWILHNSYIFNGSSSKYTQDAKLIVKICKHEITELELCPDCYRNSTHRPANWFTNPCSTPHCLVWAKLKGYPYWPAKALRLSANQTNVDCRFFGEHDRAWIPINQVFLLSDESPQAAKNPKKHGLDRAIDELHEHIAKLKLKLGAANFSPAPWRCELQATFVTDCPLYNNDANGTQLTLPRNKDDRSWSPASNDTTASSRHSALTSTHVPEAES